MLAAVVALALAAAAQGGGVPMCASLLDEAAAPCAMHARGTHGSHHASVAVLAAAPAGHGACHVDTASFSCAAGGSCPTGGTAAPAQINVPVVPRVTLHTAAFGPGSALISYLAPPLAPPPQA